MATPAEQAVIDAARALLRTGWRVLGRPYTSQDRDYRELDAAMTALDAERRATAMDPPASFQAAEAGEDPWGYGADIEPDIPRPEGMGPLAERVADLLAVAEAARTLIGTDEWPAIHTCDEQSALQDAVNRLYQPGVLCRCELCMNQRREALRRITEIGEESGGYD